MNKIYAILFLGLLISSCTDSKYDIDKKGFQVSEITEDEEGQIVVGLQIDSLNLETRPRNILLTYHNAHRLTPIFKVNYDKKTKKPFIGSNDFHSTWEEEYENGNNWNNHIMPGFEAMYGYNFVNVSHFDNQTKTENNFFEKPVLIKTLYYPAFTKDTLNYKPIIRNYYMLSVYDEDTNKDGFINVKDLRRFYQFDINGLNSITLIPKNYAVMSSEYDAANDYMYVFAKLDKNKNGQMEEKEPIAIFWIDLKNPENRGIQYKAE